MIAAALFSSAKQDHNTPLEVLELVRAFDEIGLDPCSNAQSIVGARTEWRLEHGEDGLRRSWRGHGLVFCNWPYDDGLAWARKIRAEAHDAVEIIGLGPARTDTEWFQDYIAPTATGLCFWRGRLAFGAGIADDIQTSLFPGAEVQLKEPESCAPFPSMLPYFGPRARRFKEIFSEVGWCP